VHGEGKLEGGRAREIAKERAQHHREGEGGGEGERKKEREREVQME